MNQSLLAVSSFFLPAIELEAREGFLTRQALACCLLADGPGAAEVTAETPLRYTWDSIFPEKEVPARNKALAIAGTIFRCAVILVILVLCARPKPLPTEPPPCICNEPPLLAFDTKEAYIDWIENPDLGVDLTGPCECLDKYGGAFPERIVPLGYEHSLQSDLHRMFIVDRKYPLVHLQENVFSDGSPAIYGKLVEGHMMWQFSDEDGNNYLLDIGIDGKKPYSIKDTSTSPPTWKQEPSQEGDPYSIAPDPENYFTRKLRDETYYVSLASRTHFTISWFEGNYVATLYVYHTASAEFSATTINIRPYLSCFRLEFVDLPPL